jgi:hypothetical protein
MEPIERARDEFFPGLPTEALLGMTAFSSMGSNTTDTVRSQPFHEGGPFDVELGTRFGPAPYPKPRAANNTYGRVAMVTKADALRRVLGRAPCMTHNCWKVPSGWADAIACGIAGLREHYDTVYNMLDTSIRPSGPHTSYGWLVTMTAFSRGDTQASRVLNPYKVASAVNAYRDSLSAVPEERRWRVLRNAVADTIRSGRGPAIGLKTWKMGAAYAIVRSEQKYESGAILGGQSGWFQDRYTDADRETEALITRHAYTRTAVNVAQEAAATTQRMVVAAGSAAANNPLLLIGGTVLLVAGIVVIVRSRDE